MKDDRTFNWKTESSHGDAWGNENRETPNCNLRLPWENDTDTIKRGHSHPEFSRVQAEGETGSTTGGNMPGLTLRKALLFCGKSHVVSSPHYSGPLSNTRVGAPTPCTVKNSPVPFVSQKNITTNSLLLTKSLTNSMNSRLTHFEYVLYIFNIWYSYNKVS